MNYFVSMDEVRALGRLNIPAELVRLTDDYNIYYIEEIRTAAGLYDQVCGLAPRKGCGSRCIGDQRTYR
jgi:hypothetical protein